MLAVLPANVIPVRSLRVASGQIGGSRVWASRVGFESGLGGIELWVSARICLAIMRVMSNMRPVGHDEVADRRKSSTRLGDSASDQPTP